MCGATSYRRVIARDDTGALRPTDHYQRSGCTLVFSDPKAWWEGGQGEAIVPISLSPALHPIEVPTAEGLSHALPH